MQRWDLKLNTACFVFIWNEKALLLSEGTGSFSMVWYCQSIGGLCYIQRNRFFCLFARYTTQKHT
jgi:hypothetical protein